jgi:hypothetical protein
LLSTAAAAIDLLHAASRHSCIDRLVPGFVRQHGSVDLKRFLLARVAKLHACGDNEGALAVWKYADA